MIQQKVAARHSPPHRPAVTPGITTDEDGRRHFGPAWHRRVAGVNVLKLKGSFHDMGFQHGTLLAEAIADGPIPYFRTHVERLLGHSLGRFAPAVFAGLRQLVGRRVRASLPDFARQTVKGIAAGAGLPEDTFLDGCTMPDALLWAVARVIQLQAPGPAVAHRMALGMGCTSAIAWGDATVDGKLLHARNFDYHGVAVWPRSAAVVFHEPSEGQRYVSVTAAGVGLGGITAMNEAGLSLTVHQHMFTNRARLGGTPIGTVGDIVMREARNLDDAERILGAHTPIGCWTYLIADGRRREVLCWEEDPHRHARRRIASPQTTFGYANIYLDPELGATEADLYGSYWRNNGARHRRANELLAEKRGRIDAVTIASILGDTGDPRCRVSESIAQVLTTASVIFRPEDGVVWVGTGEAPTSRNAYVPFALGDEDRASGEAEIPAAPADAAYEEYRRALVAYLDHDDVAAARRGIDAARAGAPEQPLFHALAGLVALADGDASSSEAALDRALVLGHPHEERLAMFHLWRGRARDLLGRRADAVADYRAALAGKSDPPVRKAALKGVAKPFPRRKLKRMAVDFVFADVAQP